MHTTDKQLKKSIKRIEKELQALGLNAEILRELLGSGPPQDDTEENEQQNFGINSPAQRKSNGTSQTPNGSPSLKKTASSRSLGKTALTAKKAKRKDRRQARARAEYELAGKLSGFIMGQALMF